MSTPLFDSALFRGPEDAVEFIATVLEASTEYSIIATDLDGVILLWNDGARRLYGYEPEEVLSRATISMLHVPEDAATGLPGKILEATSRDSKWEGTLNRQRRNGDRFTARVVMTPRRSAAGQIVGFLLISKDISEETRLVEALRQSETALKQAQRLAGVGNWSWYVQSNRLVWSDEMYRLFGIARETFTGDLNEVIGRAIHPDDRARVEQANRSVRQDKRPVPLEYRVVWPDGTVRVVWAEAGEMVLDEAGNPAVLSGIVQDITEHRRTEEQQRRYADRLSTINRLDRIIVSNFDLSLIYDRFAEALQALVLVDRTSIVRLNEGGDQWQVFRQWTRQEAAIQPGEWRPVAGSVIEWLVTNRVPYLESEIGEDERWPETALLLREGLHSRVLLPLLRDDQVIGVLTVASREPAAYSDEDQAFLVTLADQLTLAIQNTELFEQAQRNAGDLEQRVLERTAELEAANRELEAFSYSVSHDLRSPLRAIDGFSRILLRDYAALLPEEGQRRLSLVRDSAQQMGHLIDDLLAFSRLSRQPLNRQSVDLDRLARDVLDGLRAESENRQVDITLDDLPIVQADPPLLQQVLVNLLSNALKFTRHRPLARIQVGCQAGPSETIYFVRDNGAGFDMAYASNLFGVFQRLHTTQEFEGTGVGLAIVQRILHRHGGRVWAEAAVDQGATFYFTLGERAQ